MLVVVFYAFWSTSSTLVAAINQHQKLATYYIVGTSITCVLCYFLARRFGLYGAAFSLLASELTMNIYVLPSLLRTSRSDTCPAFLASMLHYPPSLRPSRAATPGGVPKQVQLQTDRQLEHTPYGWSPSPHPDVRPDGPSTATPTIASAPQPATSSSRPTGYLPTLDGWRAIAILSVMFCHDSIHRLGPISTTWLHEHGNLGVDVFFAISGILICSRLLTEEGTQGFISRRSFYVRRAFRILPPATSSWPLLPVLKATVHPPGLVLYVPAPALLRPQLHLILHPLPNHLPLLHQPLSVVTSRIEASNFYLPGSPPVCFVFHPQKMARPSTPRPRGSRRPAPHHPQLLGALSFRPPIIRGPGRPPGGVPLVRAAGGPLLSSYGRKSRNNRDRLTQGLRLWPLLALSLLIPITYDLIPRTTGLLLAWLMPLAILGTTLRPQSWFSRLLENPILRYLGRLSYSLYLWQQLFLISHFGADSARLGLLQSRPLNWLMTFVCALLSYYLIERPMIRFGHSLAPNVAANQINGVRKAIIVTAYTNHFATHKNRSIIFCISGDSLGEVVPF